MSRCSTLPGKPFFDPEADEALFATIEAEVDQTKTRQVSPRCRTRSTIRSSAPRHSLHSTRSPVGRRDGPITRANASTRFRDMIDRRVPIVGGGAGTGLSAKWEEAGGIDLIVIYNSGRYRMAGRGSLAGLLAYGNANEIVVDMAREVLPVVKHTPVLAGVNGTDPFYMPEVFLPELKRLGFAGVQNFPTVGLIDGVFRQNLEETGMGYHLEVEMIAIARDLDLLTTPYVFDEDSAVAMTEAGADIIVCHMGLTTGGQHRRRDGSHARRLRRTDRQMRRRGPECSTRRDRALPRRPDRHSRGFGLRVAASARHQRVLRGIEHGATADRAGLEVSNRSIQGGHVLSNNYHAERPAAKTQKGGITCTCQCTTGCDPNQSR